MRKSVPSESSVPSVFFHVKTVGFPSIVTFCADRFTVGAWAGTLMSFCGAYTYPLPIDDGHGRLAKVRLLSERSRLSGTDVAHGLTAESRLPLRFMSVAENMYSRSTEVRRLSLRSSVRRLS